MRKEQTIAFFVGCITLLFINIIYFAFIQAQIEKVERVAGAYEGIHARYRKITDEQFKMLDEKIKSHKHYRGNVYWKGNK